MLGRWKADAQRIGAQVVTINRAMEIGIPAVIEIIRSSVGDRPTYVSLDIDAANRLLATLSSSSGST